MGRLRVCINKQANELHLKSVHEWRQHKTGDGLFERCTRTQNLQTEIGLLLLRPQQKFTRSTCEVSIEVEKMTDFSA